MSQKNFQPRSKQADERKIIRAQEDFTSGLFEDIPASTIPENGIAELENMINYGNRLVGRGGSKIYSTLSLPVCPSDTSFIITSKTGYVITVTDLATNYPYLKPGYLISTEQDVFERVISINGDEITTDSDAVVAPDTVCIIYGRVYGLHFHTSLKKIVMHIDTRLFVADASLASWTEIICQGSTGLLDSDTIFDEIYDSIIFANNGSLYKSNLNGDLVYYKINETVPLVSITDFSPPIIGGVAPEFKYHMTYSFLRLNSNSYYDDRRDLGVAIEIETGNTKLFPSSTELGTFRDYGIIESDDAASASYGIPVEELTVSDGTKITPFTHYSVYRTKNISDIAIKTTGVSPETYGWTYDIPMINVMSVSFASGTGTVTSGQISENDYGCDFVSDAGVFTIDTVDVDANTFTISDTSTFDTYGAVGIKSETDKTIATGVSQEEQFGKYYLSRSDSDNKLWDTGIEVGERIFLSDGTMRTVVDLVDAGTVEVLESGDVTDLSAAWRPTSRKFTDYLDDLSLGDRFASYPLAQRYWSEIPSVNTVCVTPGFVFAAATGDKNLYYSQMGEGFEYFAGYYHPAYQFTRIEDAIQVLRHFPDKLAIFCSRSTWGVPLNVVSEVAQIADTGRYVVSVAGKNIIDSNIGCVSVGSIQNVDYGRIILITSEPNIRLFDGNSYSISLSENRINKTLEKMEQSVTSTYDPFNGYMFWGKV